MNSGMLFWLISFTIVGAALILRPVETVHWLLGKRTSSLSNKDLAIWGRIIGVAFVSIALAALAKFIRPA
jgi:hypothetical protein